MPNVKETSTRSPVGRRTVAGGRRFAGDAGGAIVEMGLMLPIVAAIVLGMVSTGMTLNQRFTLNHAAREGARYAATIPSSQQFANGGTWAENVSSVVRDRAGGELDVPGTTICVALVEGSGSGGVYVVSGPFARANYTTKSGGLACDTAETYPTTLHDLGRRIQIRITRPANIETGFKRWDITLSVKVTVKSESSA